jgi:osmotically-inducible protein OsmY
MLTDAEQKDLASVYDIEGFRIMHTAGRWILDGRVPSYQCKKEAAATVAELVGQTRVLNRLRVVPYGRSNDRDLEQAARAALLRQAGLVGESLFVSVRDGVVFLSGSVPSSTAQCEAKAAVWTVRGVVDVVHQLQIKPQSTAPRSANGEAVDAA